MGSLDRERLRVIVCFAGLFGLFFQLVAETVFGASIGAGLTGTFGTLATLPFVDSAVEKFSSKRGPTDPPPGGPSQSAGDSTPPPPEPPPTERRRERHDIESLAVVA